MFRTVVVLETGSVLAPEIVLAVVPLRLRLICPGGLLLFARPYPLHIGQPFLTSAADCTRLAKLGHFRALLHIGIATFGGAGVGSGHNFGGHGHFNSSNSLKSWPVQTNLLAIPH